MARVVVIEDDADTRRFLEDCLSSAGHQVVSASDGKQGMARIHEALPDLVITDLFMPNQEGLETIKEIHLKYPELPIIAMSGDAIAEAMLSIAVRLGAREALQKPFFARELIAAIGRVLRLDSMQPVG
jgi:CheY-like chemotaxis protein